jgi:chromosome segregation ATPase
MIDSMQLAIIVVALSVVCFVIFASVMLILIYRRTADGFGGLKGLLNDIRLETRGFKAASAELNALIERASVTVANLEPRLDSALAGFFSKASGITVSPELVDFTQDGINLLQSVSDSSAENLPKWQSENRAELNRLLAQKSQMEIELNELRARLGMSEHIIASLRKQSQSAVEAESAANQLRTWNQRLVSEVRVARKLLLESEQKYAPMVQELQLARARLAMQSLPDQSATSGSEELVADNTVLRARVVELENSIQQLQAKVQSREDELSRTLREKSFIEERFLQADTYPSSPENLNPPAV